MERSEFKVSSPRKFYGKRLTFEVRAVILSAKMDEKFQVWGVTVCTMGGRLRGVGWSCVMVGSSYTHTYARYSNTQKQVLRIMKNDTSSFFMIPQHARLPGGAPGSGT